MTQKKIVKKPKAVGFTVQDQVFNRTFEIFVGDREFSGELIRRKYGVSHEIINECMPISTQGDSFSLATANGSDTIFFIWLSKYNIEYLVHEAFHTVYMALDLVGMKLSDETNETFAYYLGYLCRTIENELKKRGIK